MSEPLHPMVPFLAGWLVSALLKDGSHVMKIGDVRPKEGFDQIDVTFASGVVIQIKLTALHPAR